MAMFDTESALAEQMKKELAKVEYQLDDGKMVSNLEAICQSLIEKSLDGDLKVIGFISDLVSGKR